MTINTEAGGGAQVEEHLTPQALSPKFKPQ
jgi:hypothetical protein